MLYTDQDKYKKLYPVQYQYEKWDPDQDQNDKWHPNQDQYEKWDPDQDQFKQVGFTQGWEFAHWFFERFCEQKSNLLVNKSESLPSLFCHKRPKQMAYNGSFVKSDVSESLKSIFK